ncbi:myb-binding protein 1A-like protein [Centruroides vittatus]|uniref:myb-binding protein 1A-like protein n=1 Tax=Centruroides vittatus TaxID=120091 RepID=UPI0035101B3D
MAISSDEHVESVTNGVNNLNSSRIEKVNKLILDSFYKLTDVNKTTRFKAVENVLNTLQRSKEDNTSDISYCLQRLIKGLASSRKAARQGFAVMLTELLRKFPSVSLDEILSLISKHLSINGDKMEKRNHIIGQIIAFAVIVRSGKFKENLEKMNEVITCLQNLQKKNYMKLIVNKLLVNIFNQVDDDCFKQYIWPHLQDDLKIGWEDCTPDTLWLLFTCMQLFPEIVNSKFLKKHWKISNVLDEKNFTHFARIIKDSTLVHPTIHPVCNVIIENALKLSNFTEFWKLIDETLFVPGQHVKIYLGFQLIKIILPELKISLVSILLFLIMN